MNGNASLQRHQTGEIQMRVLMLCLTACFWLGLSVAALPGCANEKADNQADDHAAGQVDAQTKRKFLTGADISLLPYFEKQGAKYFEDGKESNFLDIAKRNNWKILRVRLWVDPAADPKSEVSNLANVTLLAKRIKAAGFKFLLDFHYSSSWADPAQQHKPVAWEDLPFPELVEKVHDYSRDAVAHLRANGVTPDIVQVGNEIRNGLLFGSGYKGAGKEPGGGFWESDKGGALRALRLLEAGASGVREAMHPPEATPLIMLHIPDGQDMSFVKWYLQFLETTGRAATPPVKFDYDIVGLSYYPADPWNRKAGYEPWHMSHLVDSMNWIATGLRKPVMVVETNWPRTGEPQQIPGALEFAISPAGQAQYYEALIGAVRAVPNGLGIGVLVWEPEDTLAWKSVFDDKGDALPAVRVLGHKEPAYCP
jgi:arabinogalactan endo-1,4-beta-galactosidase